MPTKPANPSVQTTDNNFFKLVVFAVFVPLMLMIYGIVTRYDNFDASRSIQAQSEQYQNLLERLETTKNLKTEIDGKKLAGAKAKSAVIAQLAQIKTVQSVQFVRGFIPPVIAFAGGISTVVALLLLAAGSFIALSGRLKPEVFLNNFWLLKNLLPFAFMAQIIGIGTALIGAFAVFFTGFITPDKLINAYIRILIIVPCVIIFGVFMWRRTLAQARMVKGIFAPESQTLIGQEITPAAAPRLWDRINEIAQKIGALPPDNIILGIDGSFFAIKGEQILEPEGKALHGHSLYLPLTLLARLNEDEAFALIAHELAHFCGDDAEYSAAYIPYYNRLNYRFNLILRKKNWLLKPCAWLGLYLLEQLDEAAEGFKTVREFNADAKAASATAPLSLARALLRMSAVFPMIEGEIAAVNLLNKNLPPDMVAQVAQVELPLAPPQNYLNDAQIHRFYLHPSNGERLENLQVNLLNLDPQITPFAAQYFNDYNDLCRRLSRSFYDFVQRDASGYQKFLIRQVQRIGAKPKPIYAASKLRGTFLLMLGLACLAGIYAILKFTHGHNEKILMLGAEIAGGVLLLLGAYYLFLAWRPFMVLYPDFVVIKGLKEAINWGDVDELKAAKGYGINIRFWLGSGVEFPTNKHSGRIRLDRKNRVISVFSKRIKGMGFAQFSALLRVYHSAYQARKTLEQYEIPVSDK